MSELSQGWFGDINYISGWKSNKCAYIHLLTSVVVANKSLL